MFKLADIYSFSFSRSSGMNITSKEFGRRFRKALSVPFLLKQVCTANVNEFVNAYSSALGCSEKSFFFPFLTCAAACMGTDCYIELSALWQEPPIIWTLVVTPYSLLRINVVEHLKQELLTVQNEAWLVSQEDDSDNFKKFIFDLITVEQLQELLKINNGHGLGLYDSIRTLHKCMVAPEDTDILHRLHYGLSWFKDSQHAKSTLMKSRVNISVISTPPVVQQTLNTAPNFQELFFQSFLTVCAEETHLKFSQISTMPDTQKLREIFHSILKLHSSGPIVYKLSAEAKEKFGQIHDELTEKAKQIIRKNVDNIDNKIFQPALSYLGRLSCVLHVLDNIIESINYKVPLSPLTWNTEISAASVWHAREILGHIVEQRHALIEPTTIVNVQKIPAINLVDGQGSPRNAQAPQAITNNSPRISPRANQAPPRFSPRANQVLPRFSPVAGRGNTVASGQNFVNSTRGSRIGPVRRNLMNNIGNRTTNQVSNDPFDLLRNQNNNVAPVTPTIASVSSAGILIANKRAVVNKNASNVRFNLPSTLSVSVAPDAQSSGPALLSRTPHVSVLDISNDDFIKSHKDSIKRILIHGVSQISPSRCVQLKLICDPTNSDERQKYSSPSFARTFLKKLEKMGFGICEGQKNGNLRHFLFRKKKFSELADIQIKMLSTLGINQRDYNKCFNIASRKNTQNGGVVCLE